MIIVKRRNVERIIEESQLDDFLADGYKQLGAAKETKQKPLSKMKVDELRKMAVEKGIENADSLTKDELLEVLK